MTLPAEPRFATRATPGALNSSRAFHIMGQALGVDWYQWQSRVNRVITERREDDPRRYRYPLVVISVPRQAGKTKGVAGELCTRTAAERNHLAFYTAQTGKDARERHADIVQSIADTPLSGFVRHVKRAGAESLVWPNGSEIRAFAPTETSLHGYTFPTAVVDEGWSLDEPSGNSLLGAIAPAQQTLPNRQTIIVSTMGTEQSYWFHNFVDIGRASVDDPLSQMAYFEWSAEPDADLYDPAVLASFHPALGYGRTSAEDLIQLGETMTANAYARGIGNVRTKAANAIISSPDWAALAAKLQPPTGTPLAIAYDVAGDRSQATISVAWLGPEGVAQTMPLYAAPGLGWVAEKLVEVAELVHPAFIGAHDAEPTREVTEHLRRSRAVAHLAQTPDDDAGITTLNGGQFSTACGSYLARARGNPATLQHDGSQVLADAVQVAVLRPLADGVALSRRHSRGPIDALISSVVALRLVDHAPATPERPRIYIASS